MTDATSPVPISLSVRADREPDVRWDVHPGNRERKAAGTPGDLTVSGPVMPRPPRSPIECGDLPFLIRRDGTWLYRGSPIERKELVCLFASVLRRDADGAWWLQTPAERGRIEVEDAPFVAVELDWGGDGRRQTLSFRTNTDQVVTAGPDHPIRMSHDLLTCEPTPYILLRNGDGAHAHRGAGQSRRVLRTGRAGGARICRAASDAGGLVLRPVLPSGFHARRRQRRRALSPDTLRARLASAVGGNEVVYGEEIVGILETAPVPAAVLVPIILRPNRRCC